jgi:hypothetical protein
MDRKVEKPVPQTIRLADGIQSVTVDPNQTEEVIGSMGPIFRSPSSEFTISNTDRIMSEEMAKNVIAQPRPEPGKSIRPDRISAVFSHNIQGH